jgi:hypothetical protein
VVVEEEGEVMLEAKPDIEALSGSGGNVYSAKLPVDLVVGGGGGIVDALVFVFALVIFHITPVLA